MCQITGEIKDFNRIVHLVEIIRPNVTLYELHPNHIFQACIIYRPERKPAHPLHHLLSFIDIVPAFTN